MTKLESNEDTSIEVSSSSTKDLIKFTCLSVLFQESVNRHGMLGLIRNKRALVKEFVKELKELSDIIDEVIE